MKRDNQDFEDFKKYFREYQEKFGLNGYRVGFKFEDLKDNTTSAKVFIDLTNMASVVRLNTKVISFLKEETEMKKSAKHEALHLLLGRVELDGRCRFIGSAEMDEAAEELVNKLEGLIP